MADKIRKRLTNEVIISALLGAGSVKAAAQLLGVHPRTINSRSKSPEFKEMYAEARADLWSISHSNDAKHPGNNLR